MQEKEQKISPIKQRILSFAENLGMSKREFYKSIGVSRGTLESSSGITEDIMAKFITRYPEVSVKWLVTGDGDKFNAIMQEKEQKNSDFSLKRTSNPNEGIPLIPIEVAAGFPLTDSNGIRIEDCERYIVPEFQNRGAQFLIRVSGNSMYPRYSSGDILACRKIEEIRFIQWGKVYVIDSSQDQLVKMIFEGDTPDTILCVSENSKEFPPFSLPKDDIRSLSTVIGCIKLE